MRAVRATVIVPFVCVSVRSFLQLRASGPRNIGTYVFTATRKRVGNFPCLEWQTCPRVRDIESLKCACAIRIVRVRGVQYSAVP